MAIVFPALDPVAVHLGPLAIRWYSLAYMAGFIGGWTYVRELVKRQPLGRITLQQIDDFVVWVVLGVILGGRIGYVLFYNLPFYLSSPADAFKIWQGGMSFHGGLLGVVIAVITYALRQKIPVLRLGDLSAAGATIGLFFGRIANFINDELWGRPTDVAWGVIFPRGGPEPRHPSQLYEAFSEGLMLFLLLLFIMRRTSLPGRYGATFGIFLTYYGVSRFIIEFFREPDVQIGLYYNLISQGQILCLPMICDWSMADCPRLSSSVSAGCLMLQNIIRQQIARDGFITVADYMNLCLLHPEYGYYTTQTVFGAQGDFTTAPEISQLFGETIGIWAALQWERLGKPSVFNLVELGPGRGILMKDLLRAISQMAGFTQGMHVHFVEASKALRDAQKQAVADFDVSVAWHDSIDTIDFSVPTIIIANEFFDALPIQQFVIHKKKLA